MLKSKNQPICSGQGIIRHHLAKNWIRFFLCHLTRVTINVSLKDHHHFFFHHIPFSIFISFSYPIVGQMIATSGLGMIVICPAICFSHLLTLPKVRQLLDIALSLEWIDFRFQERRCDMTWHLLCAFVLMIFVMYHVFCCDMICYDICDDMSWYCYYDWCFWYNGVFILICDSTVDTKWLNYISMEFVRPSLFARWLFFLICLICMEHVT